MKYLLDTRGDTIVVDSLVCGQLLTPLSNYRVGPNDFAVDNGAYSGFDAKAYRRLLKKCEPHRDSCLFVTAPDVVGNAKRTLEMFELWYPQLSQWPVALVAQDGIEDCAIPWNHIKCIFVGGTTEWKDSQCAYDIVRAGLIAGVHVHVGRVNTIRRFRVFERLGAHTCDGSGVVRFGHMMERIKRGHQDDQGYLPGCDPLCDADGIARQNGSGNGLGQSREGVVVPKGNAETVETGESGRTGVD